MHLGRFGVWTTYPRLGEANAAEAARLAEDLGFGTFWLGGSPRLPWVRPLLEATTRITVATGVVNIWRYEPVELAAEYAELTGDFPDRLLVGVGAGHPEGIREFARPLDAVRRFLDGLDAAPTPVPAERRCVAALAPRMLDLSTDRSRGAHPYFVPVSHTALARARVGPDRLVAPEMSCVIDDDPARARGAARDFARSYLGLRNYSANLRRLGFTERDLAEGGSDALLDAVVPQGPAVEIAATVRAHLDAGADHVAVQPVGVRGVPRAEWTALADVLGLAAGSSRPGPTDSS